MGNQTGDRVFLFLHTNDFWRDYNGYISSGVVFVDSLQRKDTVPSQYFAIFTEIYGIWFSRSGLLQTRPLTNAWSGRES